MKFLCCLFSFVIVTKAAIIATINQEKDSLDVDVILKVTNTGPEREQFYPWELALENKEFLTASIFQITNEKTGTKVPYVGMMARRHVENFTDFVTIYPGETITKNVKLSMDYAFDTEGTFLVKWLFDFPAGAIKISKALGDRRFGPNAAIKSPTPLNCNSGETTIVSQTHTSAGNQIVGALMYLDSGASSLYTEWFGTGSRSTVTRCWENTQSRHGNAYRMQCDQSGCPRNTYAYVYPSDTTFTVYLCSVFWSIPSERAETLTHELTHFNSVCRTDDWTYGRSSCRALARDYPSRAIDNADNYCYFGSDA